MPHKHTRRERDDSTFDLPPTQVARPLPVDTFSKKKLNAASKGKKNNKRPDPKAAAQNKTSTKGAVSAAKNNKRKRADPNHDDAPRAFKRIMSYAQGRPRRSGLDDPVPKISKKAAKNAAAAAAAAAADGTATATTAAPDVAAAPEVPTIRPGERLADFHQRVDAALPLGGLVNNSVRAGKDPLGLKVWRTRKEMKMHKLYDEWREEDRKIKEKREEELEQAEEREAEDDEHGVSWKLLAAGIGGDADAAPGGKKKKKGKGGGGGTRYLGEARDAEEDPWAEIKRKRGEGKIGLNDVAKAPPEIKAPGKKFVVRGAAVEIDGIPKSAGSLRKREELQGIRHEVVASYRRRVNEKRIGA